MTAVAVFTAGVAMALGQRDHAEQAAPARTVWGYLVRYRATSIAYARCVACYDRFYRGSADHTVVGVIYEGDEQLLGKQDCVYCQGRRLAESRQARLESHDHA